MASMRTIVTRERLSLIGDALIMTAAAFSVIMGFSVLLVAPTGTPEPDMGWATAVSSLLSMSVVVVVPLLVWLMHGRRLSGMAVLGGLAGAFSTGIVFMGIAALSALLGLLVSPLTDSEFAGPIAMLVIVSAAFVALGLWLVADAIRDLAPARRAHQRIDALRLACFAILAMFAAGVAVWTANNPGEESGEAIIFAMVAGLGGGLAVLGAEILTALASSGKAPPSDPAVTSSPPGSSVST
jgi:hypothetical protein